VIVPIINSFGASRGSPLFLSARRCCLAAFALLCVMAASPSLLAHGDMHQQIVDVTKEIEKNPTNVVDLYVKRGELHRYHQDWDSAQADYDRALTLNPKLEIVDFVRGRMYLEANWLQSAKVALDRFLTRQTNHVDALITRARTLTRLDRRLEAAQDYTRAIGFMTESRPELYFERAQALAGEGAPYLKEAIAGLDEGIAKLGPLITLQLCAIDIQVEHKDYAPAIARLDQIIAKAPRKETWFARKGDILVLAGKKKEAREAFRAALQAMDSLPPARRNVPAMLDLEQRLGDELKKLDS